MIWVPADKSPDPAQYHAAIRQTKRNPNILSIPINENWRVWGFEDYQSLTAFCEDLKNLLQEQKSGVDDGNPHER